MSPLSLLYGAIVGLSLGLTGGGGAIFAVPLLVYGLNVPLREAVGVSLAAVGATAFIGFLTRRREGQVEVRTGLVFAAAGMLGAPIGTWLAARIDETLLLILFSALMVFVAVRLWRQASIPRSGFASAARGEDRDRSTCRRDAHGALILSSRCALLLLIVGVAAGVLAGLFGVGGGFVIVPALILFSGMSIHRAVGTSLLVIALVSVSGVASHILAGRGLAAGLTVMFVAGGTGGMYLGQWLGRRLSGPALQKVFSVAMLAVAGFVLVRNLHS